MENPNMVQKNSETSVASAGDVLARVRALLVSGERKILGIAAAPGAGKSTLAARLQQALGAQAQVVPMDGFHLANSELLRLDRGGRKGAPDTFDAAGYVNLLRRIHIQQPGETVYAPEYRRELEEGIAGAIAIDAATQLIITEGNYLLLDEGVWSQVPTVLDESWFLDIDSGVRQQRLLERHMRFGRSKEAALQWIAVTDEPNAKRIESSRHRASWVLHGDNFDQIG
jgi:pantothenate kinase